MPANPGAEGAHFLLYAPAGNQHVDSFAFFPHRSLHRNGYGQRYRRAAIHNRVLAKQNDLAVSRLPLGGFGHYHAPGQGLGDFFAFQTLISPDSMRLSTTVSKNSSGTPAVLATLRACRFIWFC